MPRARMWAIIVSRSGCIRGSPPLTVIIEVPRSASLSTRRSISSSGTGFEMASYSLQYVQERLHRRMGMMWARTGCVWSARAHSALPRILALRFISRAVTFMRPGTPPV